MARIALFVAGLLEVVCAFSMKLSNRFSMPVPTLIAIIGGFALPSLAMRSMPLGTAYTIWAEIGAVGAFVVGIAVLGETLSVARVPAALPIVSGLPLMKLSSST